jgi:steroid delta-isomerase-like uncharacterized protein
MVAIVQRYLDAWNTGDPSEVDETISPDLVSHDPQDVPAAPGKAVEDVKRGMASARSAFPDQRWTIDQWVVEGDRVAIASTMTGTHLGTGPTIRLPPTGKKVKMAWVTIYRIANGKIAEIWQVGDYLGLLNQIKG